VSDGGGDEAEEGGATVAGRAMNQERMGRAALLLPEHQRLVDQIDQLLRRGRQAVPRPRRQLEVDHHPLLRALTLQFIQSFH